MNSPEDLSKCSTRRTRQDRKHSSSRERLLREVEARGSASVAELSEATGLHENTIRGHLDRLCSDGFLRSERTPPSGRGRPSLRWQTVRPETRNPYAGLAIALAATLAEADPNAAALMRAAGVTWGTQLAAERHATQGTYATREGQGVQSEQDIQSRQGARGAFGTQGADELQDAHAETLDLVFDVMRDQGFAPENVRRERPNHGGSKHGIRMLKDSKKTSGPEAPTRELLLRSCPILEAARGNTEVVCAAHRGLVEGLISSRGDRLEVELQPFATPDVCVLRLGSAA